MTRSSYDSLAQDDDSSKELLEYFPTPPSTKIKSWLTRIYLSTFIVLISSLVCNAVLIYQTTMEKNHLCQTPYGILTFSVTMIVKANNLLAGLVKNQPLVWTDDQGTPGSPFTSENLTIADEAWNAPYLKPGNGIIALTDDYTRSMGLPPAQRWPWDSTKGIYVLNAHHQLHCLKVVRTALVEGYYNKHPFTTPFEHVMHCLNAFREEIICNADDTPRYTGSLNAELGKKVPSAGIGQPKLCNNWSKLEEFAVKHTSCFKETNRGKPNYDPVEEFKFCPDGRILW